MTSPMRTATEALEDLGGYNGYLDALERRAKAAAP